MKLTDTIHLLQIDFEITLGPGKKLPRFVNVILILGDRITLIDTVILSHAHPDHMGSAARIKELTGCRILEHPFHGG